MEKNYEPTRNLTEDRQAPSFVVWLENAIKKERFSRNVARFVEKGMPQVGQYPASSRTVIAAARSCRGFDKIVLHRRAPSEFRDVPFDTQQLEIRWRSIIDQADWKYFLKNSQINADETFGKKAQLIRAEAPLSEAHLLMDIDTVHYYEGKTFHDLCLNEKAGRYRKDALGVTDFGTNLPNMISTGIVTLIGTSQPLLLIALRKRKSYDYQRWASIGEGFNPEVQTVAGQDMPADDSILASAERGLKEELLGLNFTFTYKSKPSIHALLLEDAINNYEFLATVNLREMSWDTVSTCWQNLPHDTDKNEHSAIAAFPANVENILLCLNESRIPHRIWQIIKSQGFLCGLSADNFPTDFGHFWAANMPMHFVAALWYLEEVLPRLDQTPPKRRQGHRTSLPPQSRTIS